MKTHKNHDHYVDVLGLHCPQPVISCKAALVNMTQGQILEIAASDRGSLSEIPRLVEFLGDELISIREETDHYRYFIKRNSTRRKGHIDNTRLRATARQDGILHVLGLSGGLKAC